MSAEVTTAAHRPDRPQFSIVAAVYDVARYLDDFIASIEGQDFPSAELEVVAVDDGSTDGSLEILRAWQRRRPDLVTVLTKSNGGQSSARNLGLDHAHGEWITFTDPDDMLGAGFFRAVAEFVAKRPAAQFVSARRVVLDEETGERRRHPLDGQFTQHNRLRDLDVDTSHFAGSGPASFVRREVVERHGLRFDERIRPNFEDGHFYCRYLLKAPRPLVGFVPGAEYVYRKRADASSTLDTSWMDPRRFTAVPEHGYLDLLRTAVGLRGSAPVWMQSIVLYELQWYLRVEEQLPPVATALGDGVSGRFNDLLAQIIGYLDPAVIASYVDRRLTAVHRDILLHAYRDETWHSPYALVTNADLRQRTVRVAHRFLGPEPEKQYFVNGEPVEPLHTKVRVESHFGRPLMSERIAWIPFGTVRVVANGAPLDVRLGDPRRPAHHLDSRAITRHFETEPRDSPTGKASARDWLVRRLAATKPVRRLFADAWVLMDRIYNANDNAEHLFRHLRASERSVNAWFVVQSNTRDYRRLRAAGYKRIVPHGSVRWQLLMLNCSHLISSHVDVDVIAPAEITRLIQPRWHFTFLQHGVIKEDLSRWLNVKHIDVMVTSTNDEYESIAGDGNAYRLTSKEVVRTGLPRFDRLTETDEVRGDRPRDLLLIAPTWRQYLTKPGPEHYRRAVDFDALPTSEFARNWLGLLGAPEIEEAARRHGLRVGLLMHPNMREAVAALDVPPEVEVLGYDQDLAEIFTRARAAVTDYSSTMFDLAYLRRPLVYFQFDRALFASGGHISKPGYFDWRRDGFGPVVETLDHAVPAVVAALDDGPQPAAEYLARMSEAFPERDSKCCARVVRAIRDSTRRVRLADAQPDG